jgi:hypothetical protein
VQRDRERRNGTLRSARPVFCQPLPVTITSPFEPSCPPWLQEPSRSSSSPVHCLPARLSELPYPATSPNLPSHRRCLPGIQLKLDRRRLLAGLSDCHELDPNAVLPAS